MKLLRLVYEWPPPWIGLTPAPYELTRAQAKLGYDIDVLCGRWPKAGELQKVEGVNVKSFYREPIRATMLLTVAPVVTLYLIFWKLFHKVDVYHVHGHFGLYFYIYKLIFGFLDKTPVVAHYHICVKARWEESKKTGKKINFISRYIDWPLALLSDNLALKVAKFYVFVGEKVKNDVVSYYNADPAKCLVVESGVNPDAFYRPMDEEKLKLKKDLGYTAEDVVICNLGFLVERKNIHLLIESLKHLPENFKLLLVGKAESKYNERLKQIIESNKLEDRVKFAGEQDYPDVPRFFRASDIFCLPSVYEGFPKVVLEALACGVPTVASGFKVPQIDGLFELKEFDSKVLSDLLLIAYKNKENVDSEKVRNEYSWNQRAEVLDKVYKEIIK